MAIPRESGVAGRITPRPPVRPEAETSSTTSTSKSSTASSVSDSKETPAQETKRQQVARVLGSPARSGLPAIPEGVELDSELANQLRAQLSAANAGGVLNSSAGSAASTQTSNAAASQAAEHSYTVKAGDCREAVLERLGVGGSNWNKLGDQAVIRKEDGSEIPLSNAYVLKPGDQIVFKGAIADNLNGTAQARAEPEAGSATDGETDAAAQTPAASVPVDITKPPPGFPAIRWESILPDDRQAIWDGYAARGATGTEKAEAAETAETAAVSGDEASKQALIAAAEQISAKAMASPPYNPTAEELQVLFAAAEAKTGVSAQLLKAISFGEGLGTAYPDGIPRQFIDTELNPNLEGRAGWAKKNLGVDLPVALGDDREFDSQTFGLGICQLTFDIDKLKGALKGENDGKVVVVGGGRPDLQWQGEPVEVDVNRAIVDPYYNILKAAELINHKISIYTDPNRANGPISWMPSNPKTPEEWALVGSTYQTYGGFGPGGGATKRILSRMTDPGADAYEFANAQPDLSALGD